MIGWEKRVLLRHYLEQGMTKAAVAKLLGVSRRTVHYWIETEQLDRDVSDEAVQYGPRPSVPTKVDPYKGIILSRLAEYPALTAMRLFEEIKASGYVGCYTQVKEYVRKVRGLEAAFSFFGGVPHELLFDQMKAVVTKDERAAGGRVTENAEFLRFAHHWNFRIRACRPYRAKTKGKVERPVSYVRSSFFYGRTFTSDEDLNRQARHWLDHVANVRTHGTLKERPADRFEHERDLLRPLASRPYRSLVLPPEVIQQAKAVLRCPQLRYHFLC